MFNYDKFEMDDEIMKGFFPKLDLRKLEKGISFDFDDLYQHQNELEALCEEVDRLPAGVASIALKNYIVIKLVSLLEYSCKNIIAEEVNRNKIDLRNFFDKNEMLVRISDLDSIKDIEFTKGAIVVSNFNLQNPQSLNIVLSKMTGIRFLSTLRELLQLSNDPSVKFDEGSYYDRKYLSESWDEFLELFNVRNNIIHRNEDVQINADELKDLTSLMVDFISYIAYFSQIVLEIKQNNIRPEFEKEMALVLGNKGNLIKSIILKNSENKRNF